MECCVQKSTRHILLWKLYFIVGIVEAFVIRLCYSHYDLTSVLGTSLCNFEFWDHL